MEIINELKYDNLKQERQRQYFNPAESEIDSFRVLDIGREIKELTEEGYEYKMNERKDGLEMSAFILDRSDYIVFVIDNNSNIVLVNKKACETLEYSLGEMLTMKMVDIAPNMDEEIQVQFPFCSCKKLDCQSVDMYYKTKNEGCFPVDVRIYPFKSSNYYYFIVAKNISSSLEIDDILLQSEQEFLTLIENTPNKIDRNDLQNQRIYNNESNERISDFSRYFMTGNSLGQTGLVTKNQAISPVMNMQNQVTGEMEVTIDSLKHKHKEEELIETKDRVDESTRMKSFILASISHEIRTPLNCIIGLSRLLKDETLTTDERDEFIELIDNSGMKLVNMIEDVLDLAKIESGQIELNIARYNPQTIIREQCQEINEMLRLKQKYGIGVRYLEDTACANSPFFGDVKHIKQVLHILSDNAVKFTHKGEIVVGLQIAEPGQVTFYMTDSGIGIPKEKHNSIFEPFVQADISLRRAYEGLGIGLSLARRIARALGGDITLVSSPLEGSTFYFSLPICYA